MIEGGIFAGIGGFLHGDFILGVRFAFGRLEL